MLGQYLTPAANLEIEDPTRISVKSTSILMVLTLIIPFLWFSAHGAGEVDPSFNPSLIKVAYEAGSINRTVVQRVVVLPDGKVLLAGLFRAVHKSAANSIVRLNPDGTVDPTFRAPQILGSTGSVVAGTVYDMERQPDGKILIGGNFVTVGGESRPGIARLNSNGSLDPTFASADSYNLEGTVFDIDVGPDNKVTLVGNFTYNIPPNQKLDFARVFADGSLDASFYPQSVVGGTQTSVTHVFLLPGDKTLVSVSTATGTTVYRLNSAATPELTIPTGGPVHRFAPQPDGKLLVAGNFTTFNGFPVQAGIVRLNTNDSIDTSFTPPSMSGGVYDVEILSGGKVLLGGWLNAPINDVVLLNSDGTLDNSFNYSGPRVNVFDLGVQQDGQIVVGAEANEFGGSLNPPLLRLNTNGSLHALQILVGNNGRANDLFIQPDGKILFGGFFNHVDGGLCSNIARVNGDGSFDASLTSNFFTNEIFRLKMQPDSTILVSATNAFGKLNQNGFVQFSSAGASYDSEPLLDGRVLVIVSNTLRRLNTDNSTDSSFSVTTNNPIRKLVVQPDGKIIIAGFFTQVNSTTRGRIARVNADGTLDTSFNSSVGANNTIFDLALQPDGKIIIGGWFTGVNFDTNYPYLARLNADGTVDTSFNPNPGGETTSLRLQPDGKILVGGVALINGAGTYTVRRFNPNGTIDPSFNLGSGTDGPVRSIKLQAGNKILIAGEFRFVNGIDRLGVARLFNNLPARTPFDYDGDGRADISVFRASENKWYVLRSSDFQVDQLIFGLGGDIPVPADYDGDGKTDVAIFRPSNGQWWYRSSLNGNLVANTYGGAGDIPRPSDFDGDGKADLVFFTPSNNRWFRFSSLTNTSLTPLVFGVSGDQPLIGDFDGDGKSDPAVFRPSTGDWWYSASSAGGAFRATHWGQNGDIPVPADFDGDGKTDNAIFRPSDGGWYIFNSSNGLFTIMQFGTNGDRPVAADYDGDGKADVAVFRPSTGIWYLFRSTSGLAGVQFGISTDAPTPGAFIP